ncbi:MAG: LysR family transcriptional regulator [Novosphingobium sp.]|nr:LysR family transcriptional regulator [Novosphingobium sp.]
MPRLPPLAAVRAFEAAARHENFSRAAEELAMTQAGVSYQIKLLEERLGARLFTRSGRNLVLTAMGRRIAPRVSEAFAQLDDAFGLIRAENDAVLTLTASSSVGSLWLSARLGAFQIKHPDLAVRLDVSDRLVDLGSGEFDIAIRAVTARPENCASYFLMRQVFTPMASPEFLARHSIAMLADLDDVPRVTPNDEWWTRLRGDRVGAAGSSSHGGVQLDSQPLVAQAALAGHGVGLLNPALFARELAEGRLVAPLAEVGYDGRAFWLCHLEHRRNLPKIRAFREWIAADIRATLGDDPHRVLVPPEAS